MTAVAQNEESRNDADGVKLTAMKGNKREINPNAVSFQNNKCFEFNPFAIPFVNQHKYDNCGNNEEEDIRSNSSSENDGPEGYDSSDTLIQQDGEDSDEE